MFTPDKEKVSWLQKKKKNARTRSRENYCNEDLKRKLAQTGKLNSKCLTNQSQKKKNRRYHFQTTMSDSIEVGVGYRGWCFQITPMSPLFNEIMCTDPIYKKRTKKMWDPDCPTPKTKKSNMAAILSKKYTFLALTQPFFNLLAWFWCLTICFMGQLTQSWYSL